MSSLKTRQRRVIIIVTTYLSVLLLFALGIGIDPSLMQKYPDAAWILRYLMVGFIVVLVLCGIHIHQQS